MDIAIRNGFVFEKKGIRRADVGIDGNQIAAIETGITADYSIDASGGIVIPGLINAHTHTPMSLFRGLADDVTLHDWLENHIWPLEQHMTQEETRAGAKLGILKLIKTGTTTYSELYFHNEAIVEAVQESKIRANISWGIASKEMSFDEISKAIDKGRALIEKLRSTNRVKPMVAPHAPYTCHDWVIEELVAIANEYNCPLHTHLDETEDEKQLSSSEYNSSVQRLDELGFWDEDSVAAHAVHTPKDDLSLLASRGASIVHCPTANLKLSSGIAPVNKMRDIGLSVSIGTDSAASNNTLDMFREMRETALLAKHKAREPEALSAREVFDMATQGGARTLGRNSGELTPESLADIVVVDLDSIAMTPAHDIVSNLVYAATGNCVETVLIDGNVVMENREVLTMDEEAVKKDAQEAVQKILRRHKKS